MRTKAEAAQRLFIQVCDKAYHQVAAGALSYTQAVAEAVETVSRDGVDVTYPTGHKDTIETATFRVVRTGVSQACADVTEARMEELGWDTVLVSAHLGARYGDGEEDFTNHSWWQGKFYSKSGADNRFLPLEVCGMGEIQGLCGINCRHSIGPGDGVNNPYTGYDSEENRKRYDLEQRQRALERRIRKTKREVMGLKEGVDGAEDPETRAELEEKYQKKARLLQKQNGEYKQFCEDHDLKPLQERLKIAGWDRKQAASATAAAKSVANGEKSGKIEPPKFEGGDGVRELCRLDPEKIKSAYPDLPDDLVVLTDERVVHIRDHHPEDLELFEKFGALTITDPDEIFDDAKNPDTVMFLRAAEGTNLNVLVRLALKADAETGKSHSVMTAFRVGRHSLKRLRKKNKTLYTRE